MFRTLRSTYNKAIKAKCARKSDYPFDEYKVNKFDTTTQKRAIAKTDVLKFTTEVALIIFVAFVYALSWISSI